jgi:hypothetical protein
MVVAVAQRVVIVDPGHSHNSGHHAELNQQLLATGRAAGLAIEAWVDQALPSSDPALKPVLEGVGYLDPRHWLDLPGNLHLARRLHSQLQAQVQTITTPVQAWIAHSLLPFQLIGLAQLLQHQPPAVVEIGILYAPGERLGGSSDSASVSLGPEREREQALANARLAWSGLARACQQGGHRLRLGCSSQLQADLHAPLLAAAGLSPAQLQPAVVGAGWRHSNPAATSNEGPLVLLHWGDLKAGKGRHEVLELVEALLAGAARVRPGYRWLFHHCSSTTLNPTEEALLQRAAQQLPGFQLWAEATSHQAMQEALARTSVALLPYSPSAYAERSSGVLWCYGAARLAVEAPARAVGYSSGWLASEAQALGIGWHSPNGIATSTAVNPQAWLNAIDQALHSHPPSVTAYGQKVLGRSYARWLLSGLHSHS